MAFWQCVMLTARVLQVLVLGPEAPSFTGAHTLSVLQLALFHIRNHFSLHRPRGGTSVCNVVNDKSSVFLE